jgi:hypothetical protein
MAKAPRKLKVFRTQIGFHELAAATGSKAAALRAFGARQDLFALGLAAETDDADVVAVTTAQPDVVLMSCDQDLSSAHLAAPYSVPGTATQDPSPEPLWCENPDSPHCLPGDPAPTRELRQVWGCGPTRVVPVAGHSSSSDETLTHSMVGIGRCRITYWPSIFSGNTTQFLFSPAMRGPWRT